MTTNKKKIEDLHLHFIVLLTIIIEKIEELEENGSLFGKIKYVLKNAKKTFETFIKHIYKEVDKDTQVDSTQGVFIIQERVEKALINLYIITEFERERRLKNILNSVILDEEVIDTILKKVKYDNILKH